ncbi:GGDEF domain-containing protein [Shewanella sp. NFH-SH190041]|uniref:GGDEF domain-containing protein n=1 Tax=Shewanella sp. NFH-SH190041 TaxID=2950245 RepID=UPI0021C3B0A9|nr:GGDEF domain-containing protein [Shewanella sp. NFH-SH190041]BDM63504.1 GGDEF domain-containing protein [Shewanella sp. NFH-SH190041]
MLPDTINTGISVLEYTHIQLDLVRWVNQCALLKRYFHARDVLVIQTTSQGNEIIVTPPDGSSQCYTAGTLLAANNPIMRQIQQQFPHANPVRYAAPQLTQETDVTPNQEAIPLIVRPLIWPDGEHFGFLCVLQPEINDDTGMTAEMIEPFQLLLQQDLSLLCQSHRIEALSMREAKTGMLNHYGFIMMAPRQLSLGRRFGANAGVMMFELLPSDNISDRHHALLGNLLQSAVRAADIVAHDSPQQFIVLAFVYAESDLNIMLSRIKRQLDALEEGLALNCASHYFQPGSQTRLTDVMAEVKQQLSSHPLRHKPIATLAKQG